MHANWNVIKGKKIPETDWKKYGSWKYDRDESKC